MKLLSWFSKFFKTKKVVNFPVPKTIRKKPTVQKATTRAKKK